MTTLDAAPGVAGNVDLVSAPANVIAIAAGLHPLDVDLIDQQRTISTKLIEPESEPEAKTATAQPIGHWVQLGALSKETTAKRFWSDLKMRHKSLLQDREPRYFGPAEVGGRLVHVRLGPMGGQAADRLCSSLKAEGADCFCIRPGDEHL
ncbi:MAG: SPOR domain-containing protein [Pseudomonadota bacterium]